MNKRSIVALKSSGIMIGVVLICLLVISFGSKVSGFGAIVTLESILMLVVIPRIVYLDYKFKGYKPNVITLMAPFYNLGNLCSNLFYRLTQVNIVLFIVLGLASRFNRIFTFLPFNIYLHVVDYLKYGFFASLISLFLITGIGMAGVFNYYMSVHKLVYANDNLMFGIRKVLFGFLTMSNVLCLIVLSIPVVRILGYIILLDKLNDLNSNDFNFEKLENGFYD